MLEASESLSIILEVGVRVSLYSQRRSKAISTHIISSHEPAADSQFKQDGRQRELMRTANREGQQWT